MTARWRLQLLAELGVGWQIREKYAAEKAAVSSLKRSMGASSGT